MFLDLSEWTLINIVSRVVLSMLLGAVIGIDRGVKRRGGGARTTITVCMGAALVMILEQYLVQIYTGQIEISRMSAQVISGVGFLGAGSILISGHQIKGLTSAASIWTSACVGLAIGIGLIDISVLFIICWLTGLHIIPHIENIFHKQSRYMTLYIEVRNGKVISEISRKMKNDKCLIDSFDVDKPKAKGQYIQILVTFKVPNNVNKENYLKELQELDGIISTNEV